MNFSVGDYKDTIICDVLPMDACHLLLGRPWQYDHHATHEGRSNTYSFWDVGRRRVLRPMFSSDIKQDAIDSVPKFTMKPRTGSFQERGNDVATSAIAMFPAQRCTGAVVTINRELDMQQNNGPKDCRAVKLTTEQASGSAGHMLRIGDMVIKIPVQDKVEPRFRTPSQYVMVGTMKIKI